MIKVTTLSDWVPEEMLKAADPAVLQQAVEDVVSGARGFWVQRAGQKLHSSRRDYIDGIQEVETGKLSASVSLVGSLPHMVEDGASAFDMHDTLLGPHVPIASPGGRGKHVNAEGKFWRAVPFRHQVPGSIGQGGGQVMGTQYGGHSGVPDTAALGRRVYKAAKQLAPTTGMPGGATSWGSRLPSGLAPLLKPHHATDIYAGMVRQQKTYARATQSTYVTFRVISESVPWKWQHPGLTAVRLTDDVHAYIERVAPAAILAALGAVT